MPRLSIVTVNYHSVDYLARLLPSIETIKDLPTVEWIIVNNSPEEKLGEVVNTAPQNVFTRVIDSPQNVGFGAGCNLGAAEANGDILLFLNPDCEFCGGAFSPILTVLVDEKEAGAVGLKLVDKTGQTEFSWGRFPGIIEELQMKSLKMLTKIVPLSRAASKGRFQYPRRVDWVTGGAFLIKRKIFAEIGGFDECYFLYFEDVDLCKRLHQAGYPIQFEPSFQLIHNRGGSRRRNQSAVSFEYRRSQILYYQKHKNRLSRELLRIYLTLTRQYPVSNNGD